MAMTVTFLLNSLHQARDSGRRCHQVFRARGSSTLHLLAGVREKERLAVFLLTEV